MNATSPALLPDAVPTAAPFDRRAIPAGAVETVFHAADGHAIRRIDWPVATDDPAGGTPPPRGSLLFLCGRADAYEKYLETLDHWHRAGWRVTATDWRGQAGSGRLGVDQTTGHVGDFALWIEDLAQLWREWRASRPGPHVVIGFSMGGHLTLRALVERRMAPDAAVLVAPMLGIGPRLVPRIGLHGLAAAMCRLGERHRPALRNARSAGVSSERIMLLLTHDAARFADDMWWRSVRPALAMGAPSWGWLERAFASIRGVLRPGVLERVRTPTLLIGTIADRLVTWRAIQRVAARMPGAELVRFGREARHEILREVDPVRDRALGAIDGFLDRAAPREGKTA